MKFTEGRHPGEFLMSEAAGWRSREKGTIIAGSGVIAPGTILGLVSIGSASVAAKAGGNTGDGTLTLDASTPILANAMAGVYRVRCIAAASNSGTFRVENPDGIVIGDVVVGATFEDGVKFVIADAGSDDFIVGDGFDITVAKGSMKYAPSPDVLTEDIEGAEIAKAVALYGADATEADVEIAIIARDAEVNKSKLVYDSSVTTTDEKALKIAQLAAVGIIAR